VLPPPLLRLSGIVKRYPAVVALDGVALEVRAGEIHAVLGENGAGKSTLMKIVCGALQADAGEIEAAPGLRVAMVFQHFALFESMTVAENIALALPGRHDLRRLAERIVGVSAQYGLPVNPWRHVHELSMGERQRAEIVRCLLQSPQLLIMDEPTSVLTPQAAEQLFDTLRALAREGTAILYVSHKLDEIRRLCDRATILRGGRNAGEVDPRAVSEAELAERMIGRSFPQAVKRPHAAGGVALELKDLSLPAEGPFGVPLRAISLQLRAGEVLGIAGISGNGQQELLMAVCGEVLVDSNSIFLGEMAVGHLDARNRRSLGMAYVPEERLGRGAVPEMSLAENALLTAYGRGMVRAGLVDGAAAERFAKGCMLALDVRAAGPRAPARSLSGGNLQKFIVAREMAQQPKVMVLAQPTWGVDVAATAAIRQRILDLAAQGVAVLVVSEDLGEILEVCDRVAVIAGGRLSPLRPVSGTGAAEIGAWMAGGFAQ
jgi:simple sugar transport system ATP-binding protein